MQINWTNWKVGAALGTFGPLSLCAFLIFGNPEWRNALDATILAFTSSVSLPLVWAACRSKSWKMRAVFGVLLLVAVLGLYFAFFGKEEEGCGCVVMQRTPPAEVKVIQEKAHIGDAEAQFRLGVLYDVGSGVKLDNAEAAKWYRKAADQGNAKAQYHLGLEYETGKGVKLDYVEAAKWFHKAAERGDEYAQDELSYLYRWGQGVKQDYVEALFWEVIFVGQSWTEHRYSDKTLNVTPAQIAEVKKRVAEWKKAHPSTASKK